MLRGSREERKVKRQRLGEFDGLTACRQWTLCGLDGSEVQLPLENNMTVEDLRKSVAEGIGLRPGGMLVFVAGGGFQAAGGASSERCHHVCGSTGCPCHV